MSKYSSEIIGNEFLIKDTNSGITIIRQMFNPETGLDFASAEEATEFMNRTYGYMLDEQVEVTNDMIITFGNTVVSKVSELLNEFARSYRYDSIDSISKYINISISDSDPDATIMQRYKDEANNMAKYTAQCWAYVERVLLECTINKQLPLIEDIINNMPTVPKLG